MSDMTVHSPTVVFYSSSVNWHPWVTWQYIHQQLFSTLPQSTDIHEWPDSTFTNNCFLLFFNQVTFVSDMTVRSLTVVFYSSSVSWHSSFMSDMTVQYVHQQLFSTLPQSMDIHEWHDSTFTNSCFLTSDCEIFQLKMGLFFFCLGLSSN